MADNFAGIFVREFSVSVRGNGFHRACASGSGAPSVNGASGCWDGQSVDVLLDGIQPAF